MKKGDLPFVIRKYLLNRASDQEARELHVWYNSEIKETVEVDGGEREIRKRILTGVKRTIRPAMSLPFYRGLWFRLAMSVTAFVVFALGVFFFMNRPENVRYITVTSPAGKVVIQKLPDGSQAWLNAGSTLRYPERFDDQRKVELRGEAFFDIKPDPETPFLVAARGVTTRVLGTAFNVKSFDDEILTAVSVVRGKVQVNEGDVPLGVLKPNDQISFDHYSEKAVRSQFNSAALLSWRDGRFSFAAQTLPEIAGTLERWYDVKIAFQNNDIEKCRYTAVLDGNTPLKEVLGILCDVNDLQFSISGSGKDVLISGTGCD
ncbi:FecR family protein [Dyadobacter sp. CY323]|uniref:FecR family protein n=1 Tax=Dyadobacter sp. CY323 TaxID=2907302 RepID=UPI001F18027B|nr:FecR family protein [Dyadobacter sp. CY323]MCE6991113.1 DUF4974 domain-containing protein [Dyadobacter sp. CY323]